MPTVKLPTAAPRLADGQPSIGDLIESKCRTRLLTDLARVAGVSLPTLSLLRHDRHGRVKPATRAGLRRLLRLPAAELDAALAETFRRSAARRNQPRIRLDTHGT